MTSTNKFRTYALTGAVAGITATGAWYGAGLNIRREVQQVSYHPSHHPSHPIPEPLTHAPTLSLPPPPATSHDPKSHDGRKARPARPHARQISPPTGRPAGENRPIDLLVRSCCDATGRRSIITAKPTTTTCRREYLPAGAMTAHSLPLNLLPFLPSPRGEIYHTRSQIINRPTQPNPKPPTFDPPLTINLTPPAVALSSQTRRRVTRSPVESKDPNRCPPRKRDQICPRETDHVPRPIRTLTDSNVSHH
jgi:hypothetical protein